MSKLGCRCGHTIVDQTDNIPYKAFIRTHEDTEQPIDLLTELLAQFVEAREHGTERDVLISFFKSHWRMQEAGAASWAERRIANGLPDMLFSLIWPFWNKHDRDIYECESCGRLWVQVEGNHFAPYLPETETRSLLRSLHSPKHAD